MAYTRKKSGTSYRNGNSGGGGGYRTSQRKSGPVRKSGSAKSASRVTKAAAPQKLIIEVIHTGNNDAARPVTVKVKQPRRATF